MASSVVRTVRLVCRRTFHGLAVLAAVSALTFALAEISPGDAFTDLAVAPGVPSSAAGILRTQRHLRDPFVVRYGAWLGSALRGDLGTSVTYGVPVSGLLGGRVWNTLLLGGTATLLAWMIALPLGILSAARRRGVVDRASTACSSVLIGVPDVVFAVAALWVALSTGRFPTGGMTSLDADTLGTSARVRDVLWHLVLPASATALALVPVLFRHVRAAMIEALDSPVVAAAAARGITRLRIVSVHAVRLASGTLVTLGGLSIGALLSASLIVEVVTGWPGMGPLLFGAVQGRDVPLAAGCILASAALVITGNLVADVVAGMIDCRVEAA